MVFAANVRLQVEGLSGDLENNVKARLSAMNTEEIGSNSRFQARVDKAIRQGLRALGYYQPVINFAFHDHPTPGRSLLIATVTPGKPVRIAEANIVLEGEARQDDDYQSLVNQNRPQIGSILHHGAYDNFKNALSGLALRKGYFDAGFIKSQLGVAEGLHEAFWDINFNSGQRYRFGKVIFQDSQIREDYLQNMLPFREGDNYSSDQLAELSRRLSATNWFKSVVVSPKFPETKESNVLPLDAVVTPQAKNTIETGVGYSTDVGPRFKVAWKKPWLNSRGHSLETSTNVSAPEQILDFSYKIPLLQHPLEQYYVLQGGFKRKNLNDTKSDTTTLNVARHWDLSSSWQRAINLRWRLDHFTQGSVTNNAMLLYPGINIRRTRQRGGMMPTWGDTQLYSIDVSDTVWRSDVDFAVFRAQNVWIRTLAEKNRFVVRGDLGWIETNDFNQVPPDLRFFAGGDRSIRGYQYQSISPRNREGKLTGASKLVTGSLEYQYNVTGKWWGAVFVDAGEAVNDIKQSDFKTGTGIGVRWASPVGPVKLDIATPIGDKNSDRLQFYIGLGPEL